ncbi:ChaN family lipoprotein [Thalassotalea euphylliae]|nr:ChaN family lipoprotein [Thalassotalea euphylliae]
MTMLSAAMVALSLIACSSTLPISLAQSSPSSQSNRNDPNLARSSSHSQATLTRTANGWQSSTPLSNMFEFQLIDVRQDIPKAVHLGQEHGGLLDYNVVFIGENHRHPGNHLAQTLIYQKMLSQGDRVILSMEQFERDTQATLDAYLAGNIGEWALRHYGRAWDNYRTSYRPMVEMAKKRGLPVIAANAPKDTVVCTGRHGLDVLKKLPNNRKNQVAASFYTPNHGAYFEKFTGAMSHGSSENISQRTLNSYHAQIVRDDTMAESIHLAMQANSSHKVVHLNGHFHSASGLGTVERLKRLRNDKLAVIQPVLVNNPEQPTFSEQDMETGDYLLLIYPLSKEVITDENRQVWRKEVFKRSHPDCSFGSPSPS